MFCILLLSQAVKFLAQMPRPTGSPSGFISGHTAFAFGLAWVVLTLYPRWAPFWFALATAIAWSRLQVSAHYPYQVVLGLMMGTLLGWAVTHFSQGVLFPRCWQFKRVRTI